MDKDREQATQEQTREGGAAEAATAEGEPLDSPVEKENVNEDGTDDETPLEEDSSPQSRAEMELIKNSQPITALEKALYALLARKEQHIANITSELIKLRSFMTKRKQSYKRKRKDKSAPTRALSAYNMFIKDRFADLAKNNEEALKNEDSGAALKRVAPANLVAATGNEWKELSAEEKRKYEERCVRVLAMDSTITTTATTTLTFSLSLYYDRSAKIDRLRYEEQMAQYQPPDKNSTRKRNKTGYNMFFSAHVLRLKQTETGVPTERGSVARMVGDAWKRLTAQEKQFYEREADKHNDANPMDEEDDAEEDDRRYAVDFFNQMNAPHHHDMHMAPPMPPHMQHHQHDPRLYYPPNAFGNYYDYSQHHQRQQQTREHQFRYPGYEG